MGLVCTCMPEVPCSGPGRAAYGWVTLGRLLPHSDPQSLHLQREEDHIFRLRRGVVATEIKALCEYIWECYDFSKSSSL